MVDSPITEHSSQHRIRGIEIDGSGALPPSWVARLCENARWDIFALNDFALRGGLEGGVVRAAVFEYCEPMRHGDDIQICTWLARVGRTSLDFAHTFRHVGDERITARARVTIVHLGRDGPAPLDPKIAKFVTARPAPAAEPWPEGERRSAWAQDWLVRPSDQDSFGHVNQARYVDYIDDTRQLATMAGEEAGCSGPIRKLQLEYLRETHAGQRVQMQTWVTAENRRAFELKRLDSGELLSRGQIECSAPTPSS